MCQKQAAMPLFFLGAFSVGYTGVRKRCEYGDVRAPVAEKTVAASL